MCQRSVRRGPRAGGGPDRGTHWQSIACGYDRMPEVVSAQSAGPLGEGEGRGPETERSTGAVEAGSAQTGKTERTRQRRLWAPALLGGPSTHKSGGGAAPSDNLSFSFFFSFLGLLGQSALPLAHERCEGLPIDIPSKGELRFSLLEAQFLIFGALDWRIGAGKVGDRRGDVALSNRVDYGSVGPKGGCASSQYSTQPRLIGQGSGFYGGQSDAQPPNQPINDFLTVHKH
ncbi:hypothetical protein BC826DRAFT_967872 [Russula brevipes]|nr:hypothetical protein BC826DRAFT_967872 [Russula brevipes]